MFSKLNSYIQLLFAMGEVPWRTYNDILPDSIYNMDETGNDTTKHRNKIISKKKDSWTKEAKTTRTFMRTSEGDGCMPWHITICLTTRADGKFWLLCVVDGCKLVDCFWLSVNCVWLLSFLGGTGQKVSLLIQSNPVDCCFTWKHLYRDIKNGINEGACGPLLIHADKSKTKEKEAEERVRQCSQKTTKETSAVTTTALWHTVGFTELPDIAVQTTCTRSMMQEIFMLYAKHFVSSLPPNHGPIILFLDGHGSQWNKHALHFLMSNKVFPFFLASHTSIWLQLNDAGVNNRFH